jgi:hypothetical protein
MSDRELLAAKKLVKTKEAAKVVGLAESTLVVDRCTRRINIPYYKIGGAVRYDLDELRAFVESRRVGGI